MNSLIYAVAVGLWLLLLFLIPYRLYKKWCMKHDGQRKI